MENLKLIPSKNEIKRVNTRAAISAHGKGLCSLVMFESDSEDRQNLGIIESYCRFHQKAFIEILTTKQLVKFRSLRAKCKKWCSGATFGNLDLDINKVTKNLEAQKHFMKWINGRAFQGKFEVIS